MKRCQGLNSKCFLISYLIIVAILLYYWYYELMHQRATDAVPVVLHNYIHWPAKGLNRDIIMGNTALSDLLTQQNWRLIYLSHAQCLPDCYQWLVRLKTFDSAFSSYDLTTAVININHSDPGGRHLQQVLLNYQVNNTVYSVKTNEEAESLAHWLTALFLRTERRGDDALIEQKHQFFLVDPKNRLYAVFEENTSYAELQSAFIALRSFYAKSGGR